MSGIEEIAKRCVCEPLSRPIEEIERIGEFALNMISENDAASGRASSESTFYKEQSEMENISEMLRKHKLWLKDEDGGERADLSWASLSGADLSWASLSGADLSEANLRRMASGNNSEILTVQTGEWIIVYTDDMMAIGCQQHSLSEWWSFSDDQIADMDKGAVAFWRKWKPILQQIMGSYEK